MGNDSRRWTDIVAITALLCIVGLVARETVPRPARAQQAPNTVQTRFLGYNIAAPGSGVAIITKNMSGATITGLVPQSPASVYRVWVTLATGSVFNVNVTDSTTAFVMPFKEGGALTAGALYYFDIPASNLAPCQTQTSTPHVLSINFSVTTNGVIRYLEVDEVVGPVA